MLDLFAACYETQTRYKPALHELHSSGGRLWDRIRFFAADLMSMSTNAEAAMRLESDHEAQYYLSNTYFTQEERDKILAFPAQCGLLFEDMLAALYKKKVASLATGRSQSYGICSSHDVAPLFMEVFGIHKNFHKEKAFQKEYKAFTKACKRSL
jgi:hypothetical protein